MLDRLRDRVEAFCEARARERCHRALTEEAPGTPGTLHRRAAVLFHPERIAEVQRAMAGAGGAEEGRVRALLECLVFGRARANAATELDQLAYWRACTVLSVREHSLPLRAARATLARTADPELRREIEEALLAACDEQRPVVEGLVAHHREAFEELGYGDFVATCEVLSGVDLRGMAHAATRFLADTEGAHRDLLGWFLPRLAGVEPARATACDLPRLERAAAWDDYFPGSSLLPMLLTSLSGSGLDARADGRLRIQGLSRLPSGGSAVACVLSVPAEIQLSVASEPGRAACATALAEWGSALHHAHTSPSLGVEERWLGDASVPLAVGRTMEGLLANRTFVERRQGIPRSRMAEYLRVCAFLELLRARREAALLEFELALYHEPDPGAQGERYADLLTAATGVRHDPRAALGELRPGFAVARALRAGQLHAVLSAHLRERFDEDWWRNPRSGPFLTDLFSHGQGYSAAELAVQLASVPLSFDPLRARIEELSR